MFAKAKGSGKAGAISCDCSRVKNKDSEGQGSRVRPAGIISLRGRSGSPRGAADLFFIGLSAFLLLIANLLPPCWYFSLVALIPFLWRIVKTGPRRAFWLGFIYGLIFLSIWKLNALSMTPVSAGLKIISGAFLFALFGWAASRTKEKWGFNPLLVALLWVGLEYGLIKLGFGTGFLEAPFLLSIAPFFYGLGALFGFLAISFVIALINSALMLAVEKILAPAKTGIGILPAGRRTVKPAPNAGLFPQPFYLLPEDRGPPLSFLF